MGGASGLKSQPRTSMAVARRSPHMLRMVAADFLGMGRSISVFKVRTLPYNRLYERQRYEPVRA